MSGDFLAFARGHGLLIDHVIDDGKIHRVKTADKAHKANGAYRFCGRWGWVQVWHEHAKPIPWTDGKPGVEERRRSDIVEMARRIKTDHDRVAKRAREVLASCRVDYHHYLTNKGHPIKGLVTEDGRLAVSMWAGDAIANVQLIDREGGKKFLPGGAAKGTRHVLGPREGVTWYVEGLATGLSVLHALKYMSIRGRVVCCFFASNLEMLAAADGRGFVFADHDTAKERAGQTAAEQSCRPWVMSPEPGEDANDLHQRAGIAAVANLMRPLMRRRE